MSRFRTSHHEVPGLNTASLPDLIFTVLFFFMIVTHIRQAQLKVEYRTPQGTELVQGRVEPLQLSVGREESQRQ